MKIKELIISLENFNPEKEIKYRNYDNDREGFLDLSIHDIRIGKDGEIVMATQSGVE